MKYNQYAYRRTSYSQAVQELQTIHFLPQNFEQWSFSDLLAKLIGQILAEAKTAQAKRAKSADFAISRTQTFAAFLKNKPNKMTAEQFANLALQLLGYHIHYDYHFETAIQFLHKQGLPTFRNLNSLSDLVKSSYRLLNTRAKNGQLLVDVMAGKGYFTQFWGQNKFLFFNGKSLPVFNTNKVIREVVYVASDLDTDEDGKNDLLQVSIFRPEESNHGLKVPVLYTASPYFGGIINNEKTNHHVDENLTDATHWTDPKYVPKPHIPAKAPTAEDHPATERAIHHSSYSLNEYLLARGFACVFAGAIGTRGSDGLRITGAPEETEAAKAVIEWLHGDRVAYTDRSRKVETKASWCNHKIGMTGRSYLGTLQIALATTGVPGLKTVVSEAAISSWYDYYREHGLVVAPVECQGEDLDKLAETCQSNLWDAGRSIKIRPKYQIEQKELLQKEDRTTGQYSDFWEVRNYRHQTKGIKCSWISVHGLNDWNVKPKNVYKLWQKIKQLPQPHHLFLHQGPHYNINNLASLDFTDLMNLWFSHELLGQNNNAPHQWPTVLVQSNLQANHWLSEKDWNNNLGKKVTYYPTNDHQLQKNGNGKARQSFLDVGGQQFKKAHLSGTQWEKAFISGQAKWSKPSLRYLTDSYLHPVTIVGRPLIKIRVAASRSVGQLSVALIELGKRKRLTPLPKTLIACGQELGYRFGTEDLKEFVADKVTPAKLITKAHMNLQNFESMKKPKSIHAGTFHPLSFQLQPTYYTIPKGSRLMLIIYSTDEGMTKRPLEEETYTIDLAHTELTFSEK